MGNRANIHFRDEDGNSLFFYTHWDGISGTWKAVHKGLSFKDRWQDSSYLARMIFCQLIRNEDIDNTNGYGISCDMQDNENNIVLVLVKEQEVRVLDRNDDDNVLGSWTFEEFIQLSPADWQLYE